MANVDVWGAPIPHTILLRRSAAHKPIAGVLCDGRVKLEPYDPARHLDDLHLTFGPLSSRPGFETDAVFNFLGKDTVSADTVEATESWMQKISSCADALTMIIFVRADVAGLVNSGPQSSERWCLAGTTSLMSFRPDDLVVEIGGVAICPRFQRTPVNTAATRLLLRHAFEVLGCRRVEWKCNSLNEPSKAAAIRLGFTFEGIFRHHMIVRGLYNRDTAWFSMLEHEWPAKHAALDAFLESSAAAELFRKRAVQAEAAGVRTQIVTEL